MNLLRSTLYMIVIAPITIVYGVFSVLTFPFAPQTRYRIISCWAKFFALPLIHSILGIRYRVIGRENLPATPSVILCKHQSAWETIALQRIFPPVAFVLKRELLRIPFFGWGLAQMPIISIDRNAGKDALKQVVDQGKQRIAEGFWVVIFPEGTRAAIGFAKRYKIGGASLATVAGVPVVPVAHNAGEFWQRNAFVKSPGNITLSIGPVIETAGRTPEEVNALAEAWIEGEMRRLFPHHYKHEAQAAAVVVASAAETSKA
ncbi:MAG: 1-acyl-sn-glycerol-3-phosphate acyltransferase [Rhodocyclales bacterium]|nr:1-acyl-sn-glycerol-3-phosphate acyltransferase [Rhodocyclales bacterium]